MSLRPLEEPRAGRLTLRYAPESGAAIHENPPRFAWLPTVDAAERYVLQIAPTAEFLAASILEYANLEHNFFTPDRVLTPDTWHWRYAVWDAVAHAPATVWSTVRRFELCPGRPETPLPRAAIRYGDLDRPRLWLRSAELTAFSKAIAADPDHLGWSAFHAKSVVPWITRPIMAEPRPYPNDVRTAEIWRQTYIECQEAIYAIRHLAVAGRLLNDAALLDRAIEWLLAVADWDPTGPTSRVYSDEWAFRVNLALAWGYDWLAERMSAKQRAKVRAALLERTRQTAEHCIRHARINIFPYDSHAVRAVSAVLVPSCIALLDDAPQARAWLDFCVEFLFTLYSPWGDSDGGWAEGPHYWMTGLAYLTDAANLLKKFCGLDLYRRPFFQHTGDFPLYTKAADTRRATFGDDSTMGDPVCLKVGGLMRQFAGVTGNGVYQWYCDAVRAADPGTERAFYNYGWWDLNFDELVYRHDHPDIPATSPATLPKLKCFRGVGWAGIQHRADDPDQHIHFVTKASPYGSISHSHADQNAFTMSAFGEDLAIQSGHYVAFNSSMHKKWRRQTHSKNAILIDGKGQYADADKARAILAAGSILAAEEREDHIYIKAEATEAYASLNSAVRLVTRETYFVNSAYFIFVDTVAADAPVTLDWLIHTRGAMRLGPDNFRFEGRRAGFYGQFVWASAGDPSLSQHEGFRDVDPQEIAGLELHWHLEARFAAHTRHRTVTVLAPYRLRAPRRIFHFTDDQGYNTDLYFIDEDDRSFRITLPKLFNP